MILDYSFELRKLTAKEDLYDKVKEYVNLAEGIVTDDMGVEARYKALAGLYRHIDNENGGYVDPIRNAPDIDGVNQKNDGNGEHSTGNALSRFIKYAKEKFHDIRLKSVDSNGVEHYVFGLNWHPQKGFEEAQELLFMLLTVIGYDGEFYWKQIKIRTGEELPKFWESDRHTEKDTAGGEKYAEKSRQKELIDFLPQFSRFVEDIAFYLRATKESGLKNEIAKFKGLENEFFEYTQIFHNIKSKNNIPYNFVEDESLLNITLDFIGYPIEWDFDFEKLVDFVDEELEETIKDGNVVWWTVLNDDGISRLEILSSLLLCYVEREFCRLSTRLYKMGFVKETTTEHTYISKDGRRPDKVELEDNTEEQETEKKDHICIDGQIAKNLYMALTAENVCWMAENMTEEEFVNILTLPPSGQKIKFHQLNQINYVTKKVLFHEKSRMAPEEWDLIRQLFDAEHGNMVRVNRASKDPENHEIFDQYMGI